MSDRKIFATLTEDGDVIGFYPSDIFATPPKAAVELSEDQYNQLLTAHSTGVRPRVVNGSLVNPPATPAADIPSVKGPNLS